MDAILQVTLLNRNVAILSKNSIKCVPKGWIDKSQVKAWCQIDEKPLSEPIPIDHTSSHMVSLGHNELTYYGPGRETSSIRCVNLMGLDLQALQKWQPYA